MKILLASRNQDKLREVQEKVNCLGIEILTPRDFPELPEVEENGASLAENASLKAITLHRVSGLPTLADDTGLEVEALNGAPGVYSARFAGPGATYADNVAKLLKELTGVPLDRRQARFRCVLAYATAARLQYFSGQIEGLIVLEAAGEHGFGYDPVFYVLAEGKTLAQIPIQRKNQISHRGQALDAWVQYLRKEAFELK